MENKKQILLNSLIIFLYAVCTLIFVLHHEIWADEAQAWLVVRDLNILGIIEHVRTEGHPLLWYFVLLPFAKLPLQGAMVMQIINWLVVVVALGIWMFKSPFNFLSKSALLLSSGFLYWYAVIARSYCFIPLFMFLIAILYKKQKEHPFIYALLIILLANTHIIMLGFCTGLAILFLYNNRDKKSLIAASLMLASFACISLYLWGSQNENIIVKSSAPLPFRQNVAFALDRAVLNIYSNVTPFYTLIFYVFTVLGLITTAIKNRQMLFLYVFNIIFQFGLYMYIWGQIPQRIYTLFLVIIFCFWIMFGDLGKQWKTVLNIAILFAFLPSFSGGLTLIKQDLKDNFSDGKRTAEFIKTHIPQDAFIASNYPLNTTSISVYLPQNKGKWKFYYHGYKDYYTYSKWDKDLPPGFAPLPLADYLKNRNDIYVILSLGTFYEDIKPIYTSSGNVFTQQEKFSIYHITRKQIYGK